MGYSISYGLAPAVTTLSGLTTAEAVDKAYELTAEDVGKLHIFDDDGDPVDLHTLELALQSVSVRSV